MTVKTTHICATETGIPLHLEMRRLYGEDRPKNCDDRDCHQVLFGVAGVDRPAGVVISSEGYENALIAEHLGSGELNLPEPLFDALALKCFGLISGQIIDLGGESGFWSIPDISQWIQNQFPQEQAQQLLKELQRHVNPRLTVRNVCLVTDDDAL